MTISLAPSTASNVAGFVLTGYIVRPNQIQVIESQTDGLNYNLAGVALGQGSNTGTFSQNNLEKSTYVFGSTGMDAQGAIHIAGAFTFNNGALTGPISINDLTNRGEETTSGGTYVVENTGRGTLSNVTTPIAPLGGPYAFQIYVDGNGNVLVMGADNFEISAGPSWTSGAEAPSFRSPLAARLKPCP